jgi:hypothetical protein
MSNKHTPGGIKKPRGLGHRRPAGRTLIAMTNPATIDSGDLSERLSSAAPPRVLDVRTPGEFETAHIAGSGSADRKAS